MIYLLALLILLIILNWRFLFDKWITYRFEHCTIPKIIRWLIIRHMKRLTALIPGDEGIPIFGNSFGQGRTSECEE